MFVIDNTYKSDGGFTGTEYYYVDYLTYNFESRIAIARYFFDFIYLIIVVVLLAQVIGGLIIDTFA